MTKTENVNSLTEKIIGCAFAVHNKLGQGFLEKVYENSLIIELNKNDVLVEQQSPIPVYYDEHLVGDYYADLVVNNEVIVEIKAVENLNKKHEVQLVNYLTATGIDNGLLINFGESVEVKRKFRIHKSDSIVK